MKCDKARKRDAHDIQTTGAVLFEASKCRHPEAPAPFRLRQKQLHSHPR